MSAQWSVGAREGGAVTLGENGLVLFRVVQPNGKPMPKADMLKIAAAPELLKALHLARCSLVAFKFMPGDGNAWEDHDEVNLQAVYAAIRKAGGVA